MIHAICLNPVIDRTYCIDEFTAGKLYMHNEPTVTVGGKGINAARVCKQLGARVTVYGFIAGLNGQAAAREVHTFADVVCLYELPGETRMTVNIIDCRRRTETEILERGPVAAPGATERLLSDLSRAVEPDDIVICSGITINGAKSDIYVRISALCTQNGARCLLDTRGIDFKNALGGHYCMIKPNRQELEELFGEGPFSDLEDLCVRAREQLLPKTDQLLISLGAQGGVLLTPTASYRASVPDVSVVSTIGCGDSTVAGFATALSDGQDILSAFSLAMACGVSNSMNPRIADVRLDQIREILPQIEITKT